MISILSLYQSVTLVSHEPQAPITTVRGQGTLFSSPFTMLGLRVPNDGVLKIKKVSHENKKTQYFTHIYLSLQDVAM